MKLRGINEQADGRYGLYHRWLKRNSARKLRRMFRTLIRVDQAEDVTPRHHKRHLGWES